MKIFSAAQFNQIDKATIAAESISSLDLMERAAKACADWITERFTPIQKVAVICGRGNNGGDGMAVARLLLGAGYPVRVLLIQGSPHLSKDCRANLERLPSGILEVVTDASTVFPLEPETLIVDALYGTGLNRAPEALEADVIDRTNQAGATVISIDLPSGMFADRYQGSNAVVRATHTLTFEAKKLAFLMPGTAFLAGKVEVLPIGLDPGAIMETQTPYRLTEQNDISSLLQPRPLFSNKGNYGNDLLIAGSYGKMGAAVLSAKGCLRSGAGLVTCLVPDAGYAVIQTAVPEAMCRTYSGQDQFPTVPELEKYTTIGIGPGLGTTELAFDLLVHVLTHLSKPMVLDADALNLLSRHPDLIKDIPPHSILTPHPKEFERLFGKTGDAFQQLELLLKKSSEHRVHILLKGRYTAIGCPDGRCFFNPTGNPGMSTGGTGDALTGIITGMLGQGYSAEHAAVTGAYLHGLAGDIAAGYRSPEAMTASDLIENLGEAFKTFKY
jgi:hydroxyethylthiazole kinase-like uncharacterized protein yjeF